MPPHFSLLQVKTKPQMLQKKTWLHFRYAYFFQSTYIKNEILYIAHDLITNALLFIFIPIQATLQKDKTLAQFLADPSIKKPVKVEGLGAACDKLKMSALTKNMLLAMAENGR